MKNIGVNDSAYVIKPLQPSSAIYGVPPFTGNPWLELLCRQSEAWQKQSKNKR